MESDSFLDMPSSTQMLYIHLAMNADDDGFVNNPKKIQRMCGASDDDYKVLLAKRFILVFENGVVVIKHWKMHNYIPIDRYKPTDYVEEKSKLGLKANKAYTLHEEKMVIRCIADNSKYIDDETRINEEERDRKKYDSFFEKIWKIYPRKEDKGNAYRAYLASINSGFSESELMDAVKNYAEFCRFEKKERRYIKVGATFFGKTTPFVDYLDENYKKEEEYGCVRRNIEKNTEDRYESKFYGEFEK